jgi:hypothetical protein
MLSYTQKWESVHNLSCWVTNMKFPNENSLSWARVTDDEWPGHPSKSTTEGNTEHVNIVT